MFDKLPDELKALLQWLLWRLEERDGHKTKVPYQTNGHRADATAPETWNTFDVCVKALQTGRFSGIGFVFTKDSGLVGIDLDKCRNPETGETEAWAKAILNELSSYTELSQSGRGWHVVVKGSLPAGGNRKGRVEMYDHDRYFVMTGKCAANSCREIQARDVTGLHARLLSGKLDPQPVKHVTGRKAKVTDKSPSGKDFALIGSIARELCTKDPVAIDSELRNRYPEYYADREFAKSRPGGYWIYSIERFLKYRRDRIFRKPARIG